MSAFNMWKKVIVAKSYSREEAVNRVNAVFAVKQLNIHEYTELMDLINATYKDDGTEV